MTRPVLGDVYGTALDGALGLSARGNEGEIGIVGISSQGPVNGVETVGRGGLADAVTRYGTGPLTRALRDVLMEGQVARVMRVSTSEVGTIGTPDTSGKSGDGTIGFTGSPKDEHEIVVEVLLGGALATTTFRWSPDNGDTWSVETAAAAEVALGTTGVTATFTQAATPADSFDAGDLVRVRTTAPVPTLAELQAALAAFKLSAVDPPIILIPHALNNAALAALDVVADAFHALQRYTMFVCEVRRPTTSETWAQYVTALLSEITTTSEHVLACAGRVEMVGAEGTVRETNAAALIAGRLSVIREGVSAGRTGSRPPLGSGPLPGAVSLPAGLTDDAVIADLDAAGFTTVRTFRGPTLTNPLRGVFVNNARMLTPQTSDYRYAETRRLVLLALRRVREALLPHLQGDAGADSLAYLQTVGQQALDTHVIGDGRAADAVCLVPLDQDVTGDEEVDVEVRILHTPKARWIHVSAGMTRSIDRG